MVLFTTLNPQVNGEPMVQYVELAQPSGSISLPQQEEALLSTRRRASCQDDEAYSRERSSCFKTSWQGHGHLADV